ncbi:MAG: hypothetical protein OEY49_16500, partial [Candidatus Heimdallarchaeota archaeon]|nr:hypothetical protein [Candidatus Heimdallarchaeota archaeon]
VLHKFRQPTLLQDFIPKIRSDTEIISIVHQVNPINELLIQTSEVDISTESNILTQSYDENFDESEENTLDEKLYKNVLIVYPSMSFLAAISTLDNFSIREIEAKVLIDEKIDDVTSYLLENQLLHQVGNHYRIDYDIFRKFNTVKDKFMQTKFKENVTDLTDCSILLSQIRIDLSDFDSTASEKENTLYLLLHVLNVLDRLAPFNNDVKYINNGLGLYFSFIKYFDNPIIFESILHQFNIFRGHIEATITSIQNEQLREAIFISESELETKIQNSSLPEIIIQENQYNQLEVVDSDIGEEGDEIDVEVNIEVNDKLDKDLQRQNHGGKSRIVMPFESIEEDTQDTGIIQDLQRNQSNVKSLINNIINDNSNENEVINKLQGEFTIDEEKIEHNNPITSKKGVKESIKPVLSSLEINEEFSEIIVPWDIIDSKYDYVHILGDTISFQYNEIFTFTYLIILKNESLIVNNEFNYLIRYLPINKLSYERYLVLYELYNYSNMLIELKEKIELSKSRPKRTKMASIKFIRNSKAMSKNLDDFLRNYNLEISENTLFKSIYIVNDMVKTSEYNEEQNYLLMFMEMILDLYREKSWPLCLLPKLREIDLDKNKFLSMDTFECLRTIDITEDEFKLIKVYVQIIDNEIKDFSGEDDIQSIEIPNQTIENNVSYNPDYVDELMKEIERERNLKDKKAKEVLNKITHSPKDNKRQPVIREIQLNWLKGITKKEVTMFTKLGIITVSDFLNNIQKIEGFSKERVDELYVLCTLAVQNPNQEINHVHLPNYYYSDLLSEKVNDRLLQQAIQKIIELHHTGPLILLGKIILEVIIPSLTGNHVMQSVQEAIELINKASINTPTQIYNLTEGITDIESKFQSTPLFRNYIMDSYAHKLYQILQDIQFSKEFIANLVELINPIN